MKITETLYVADRVHWRAWLEEHHTSAADIWLIFYKKHSNHPRLPYNDAVEEALCFGWIDSTVKALDNDRYVQRFSPRRKNSQLSEMNKERVRQLIIAGKMTPAGLQSISHHLKQDTGSNYLSAPFEEFKIPVDILRELKADARSWKYFSNFPEPYKRVRIGWIDSARSRPEEFDKRLRYFLKMTSKNKKFGMIR